MDVSLQGNSWLWTLNGLNILVDPVLVGNLDFGIPFLYDAAKKSKLMKEFTVMCSLLSFSCINLLFSSVLVDDVNNQSPNYVKTYTIRSNGVMSG